MDTSQVVKLEQTAIKQQKSINFNELKKFQTTNKQLDNYCIQIYKIIEECQEQHLLPVTLIKEVSQVSKKMQSQRLRLAVISEFSQDKLTLLNALLSQEIQTVRTISCSTVTVIKYGTQKRVICRYKDGREEEIPY